MSPYIIPAIVALPGMVALFGHGSVDGGCPEQSLLSHLQLIISLPPLEAVFLSAVASSLSPIYCVLSD